MALSILGIGTAVPASALNQRDAQLVAEMLARPTPEQATFIPSIYAGSGITTRYICFGPEVVRDIVDNTRLSGSPFVPDENTHSNGPTTRERMELYEYEAPRLGVRACAEAISDSGVLPSEISHLVTVSCTGFSAPGLDIAIINELGLSPTVHRTHVGFMGCHAALNGFRVANAFTTADPDARVLLCSVELCSLHYHFGWDPPKVVANALFADGGGAIVGAPTGPPGAWKLVANGSHLLPEGAEMMTWIIGDHGFGMTLSKKIPEVIGAKLRPWLDQWLASRGHSVSEIKSWAIHPGGPKILDSAASTLNLPPEAVWASREVLDQYGNMSSATMVFILRRLIESGAKPPCVSIGFGPGLNVEVALFE